MCVLYTSFFPHQLQSIDASLLSMDAARRAVGLPDGPATQGLSHQSDRTVDLRTSTSRASHTKTTY